MKPLEFYETLRSLAERGVPFATATVVRTEGSTSAKPGATLVVSAEGAFLIGWAGGGCAESTLRAEALAAIKEGFPRVVTLDLTDEVFGVGTPCGGKMEVFVEPHLPPPHLVIVGHGRVAESACVLAREVGFQVCIDDPLATAEAFPRANERIVDDTDFARLPVTGRSYVLVTTQHRSDDLAIERALEKGARYVALLASRHRAEIVRGYLRARGVSEEAMLRVHSPAGLDLGAVTPEEMAFSVVAGLLAHRSGGTGRPIEDPLDARKDVPRKA
ncbi:MAG: XdhC family protein [Planctomycetota bacterium]